MQEANREDDHWADLEDVQADAGNAPAEQPGSRPEPTGETDNRAAPPADTEPNGADRRGWVPQRALEDERGKRQLIERNFNELQRQLDELKRESEQRRQPAVPEIPEGVDWYSQPEVMAQHQARTIQQAFNAELEKRDRALHEIQQRHMAWVVHNSEQMAKAKYEDFDEVMKYLHEIKDDNMHIIAAIERSPDPAETAYAIGRNAMLLRDITAAGGRDAYLQQMSQAAPAPAARQTSPVPRSLGRDVSAQPRSSNGRWSDPTPLEDIFDD